MSLVAYGSSGEESDSNDSEDVQDTGDFTDISRMSGIETGKKDDQSEIKGAQIATEESLPMEETFPTQEAFPAKGRGLVLPSPKKSTKDEAKSSTYTDKRTTLSSFLPKPKNTDSTERKKDSSLEGKPPLSFGSAESEDEIIDIEEEFVPLAQRPGKTTVKKADDNKPKSVGSLFSLLPPPWQSDKTWLKREEFVKGTNTKSSADHKKAKQPVKISIPTAPQLDSDEEEESSDEPAAKKMRPAKGGAGLKSLLPKPKHSITTKADNPNKPAVKLQSRPLIPYTLTRKPSKEEKSVKKPQKNKQTDEAGSDDEDEPVSFFTFHDKSSITPADVREEMKPMDLSANTIRSNANVKASSSEALNPFASSVAHSVSSPTTTISHGVGKQDVAVDFPKSEAASSQAPSGSEGSYEAGELETRTYFYEQQSGQTQQYGGQPAINYGSYNYDTSGSTVTDPYYGHDQETYTYTYPTGAEQTQNQPQETNIDMEKLHKLQGRKKRREEINIVDVNADDQIGDAAVQLTKITTEEIAHRPSRKKSDMPTSQQRRKHQITYLAFQAKERELELRQQWSANSQTRRHTQSKYGF